MNVFSGKLLKSEMRTYYADHRECADSECWVRFSDGGQTLSVIYDEQDNAQAEYEGLDGGGGHYTVKCPHYKGFGTLHLSCDPDGEITLEGWWLQEGSEGMWRIEVEAEEAELVVVT
jgi:hypothetical protein